MLGLQSIFSLNIKEQKAKAQNFSKSSPNLGKLFFNSFFIHESLYYTVHNECIVFLISCRKLSLNVVKYSFSS